MNNFNQDCGPRKDVTNDKDSDLICRSVHSYKYDLDQTESSSPRLFVSGDLFPVFLFHGLTVEVPGIVIEGVFVPDLAITLVGSLDELLSSQVDALEEL